MKEISQFFVNLFIFKCEKYKYQLVFDTLDLMCLGYLVG